MAAKRKSSRKKNFKFDFRLLKKWREDRRIWMPACAVLALTLLLLIDIPGLMREPGVPVTATGKCAADKECVWQTGSFLFQTEIDPKGNEGSVKWREPLKIQFVGARLNEVRPQIDATLEQAHLSYPEKIRAVQKDWNAVVVVSDDFNQSFKQHMPALQAIFGKQFTKVLKNQNKSLKKNKCVSAGIRDQRTKLRAYEVLFVSPDENLSDCILNTLLFNADTYGKQGVLHFSELHHLLLSMIYDKRMAKAKTMQDARAVFDDIYPKYYKKMAKNFPAPPRAGIQ